MSLSIEEMNQQWEAAQVAPIEVIEEKADADANIFEDDDDEDEYDPEAALNNACDILQEVMEVLGAWGQLTHHIHRDEKREMLGYAQQIYEFLTDIGEIEE